MYKGPPHLFCERAILVYLTTKKKKVEKAREKIEEKKKKPPNPPAPGPPTGLIFFDEALKFEKNNKPPTFTAPAF